MNNKFCPVCGAEIIFEYITQVRTFKIDAGTIVRDDAWQGSPWDDPLLQFRCEDDPSHDLGDSDELCEWKDSVEMGYFRMRDEGRL